MYLGLFWGHLFMEIPVYICFWRVARHPSLRSAAARPPSPLTQRTFGAHAALWQSLRSLPGPSNGVPCGFYNGYPNPKQHDKPKGELHWKVQIFNEPTLLVFEGFRSAGLL